MENPIPTKSSNTECKNTENCIRVNTLRWMDYVGIGCQSSMKNHPYFFLFCDVDTKDPETLRLTLQIYARFNLSFFYYSTNKGYHVISTSLMELSDWDNARKSLSKVNPNFYRNLVLRLEHKDNDGEIIYWNNFDTRLQYFNSQSLMDIYNKKFNVSVKLSNPVETSLFFTHYEQLR